MCHIVFSSEFVFYSIFPESHRHKPTPEAILLLSFRSLLIILFHCDGGNRSLFCRFVIDDIPLTNLLCVRCSTRYQHIGAYNYNSMFHLFVGCFFFVCVNMIRIWLFLSFFLSPVNAFFPDFLISTPKFIH